MIFPLIFFLIFVVYFNYFCGVSFWITNFILVNFMEHKSDHSQEKPQLHVWDLIQSLAWCYTSHQTHETKYWLLVLGSWELEMAINSILWSTFFSCCPLRLQQGWALSIQGEFWALAIQGQFTLSTGNYHPTLLTIDYNRVLDITYFACKVWWMTIIEKNKNNKEDRLNKPIIN